MRTAFIRFLIPIAAGWASAASAGLTPRQFQALDVGGFRLEVSLAEADAVIRARTDLEETFGETMPAFNCGALLPAADPDSEPEDLQNREYPIYYFIEDREHALFRNAFESTPYGTRLYHILHSIEGGDWATRLADAERRYGAPDVLSNDGRRMQAVWCLQGETRCGTDDVGQRLMLRWRVIPDRQGNVRPSGEWILERRQRMDDYLENDFAELARRDPNVGKRLFERCMQAPGTFADESEFEAHRGNLVGSLATWSLAIGEPREVHGKLLRAIGFDPHALMARHDCAMRRQAGVTDFACDDWAEFRWMRTKGNLSLFALRFKFDDEQNHVGHFPEHLYYCLVREDDAGAAIVWSGTRLTDLPAWLAARPGAEIGKTPASCPPPL